jgi:2-succinyl-5-enolpyruvyl-6-hydroxy-3-cyclohexene-1-carboxylate synthase
MIFPKIPLAQSIVAICKAKGVHNIIISPGSRNAPLTIGFTNDAAFTCYSIADERCAAFFGMGIAQQTQKPVALVCTSGSALLNYYPAFAEAYYSQIPLLVISADRPRNKVDIGDGQTIRQENVFANHSLFDVNLDVEVSEESDVLINEAINVALAKKGPVHLNVPFEEPLYETVSKIAVDYSVTQNLKATSTVLLDDVIAYSNLWNHSKKILIIVGVLPPNSIQKKWLDVLAKCKNVIVMTETTSNLHHKNFISKIDTFITPMKAKDFLELQPRILITIGGMIVSKRIKSFLRKYKPKQHWHIDELRAYDTFGMLTKHFKVEPNQFFTQILPHLAKIESSYQENALAIMQNRNAKHKKYLEKIPFSDLKGFELILSQLPAESHLQLGNSSPIRYAQLFTLHKTIDVYCNRGTSGIDGCASTAIGAAIASKKQTTLIIGDISFFYDSNALWNNYIPKDFKIIVINNGGGGIFRILPGHQENNTFNVFFETSHCLTIEHLARMFQLDYYSASDEITLLDNLRKMYKQNLKPAILEVFTPTKDNDAILLNYFKALN